jgi:hypothetical protein
VETNETEEAKKAKEVKEAAKEAAEEAKVQEVQRKTTLKALATTPGGSQNAVLSDLGTTLGTLKLFWASWDHLGPSRLSRQASWLSMMLR